MVERSQVFTLRANENDLSGVALVAGLTRSNLQVVMMFGMRYFSSIALFNLLWITSKQQAGSFVKSCLKMPNSTCRYSNGNIIAIYGL